MSSPAFRDRYLGDSVSTASPSRLLVMLYERLVLDLVRGEEALRAGDRDAGSGHLMHAQEIVIELRATLDIDAWEGALGLAKIYGFVLGELITANIRSEPDRVASCRSLLEPLLDAWRTAADMLAAQTNMATALAAEPVPAQVA